MPQPEVAFDVAIVGGGPAGAACALALSAYSYRVLLLEAAQFPRDKICGDAIPGLARQVLQEIAPQVAQELEAFRAKVRIQACRVVAPRGHYLDISFSRHGYCCPRLDFDQFLFKAVQRYTRSHIVSGQALTALEPEETGLRLHTKGGSYRARLVVGADGAQSLVRKTFCAYRIDRRHHIGAVRAYYRNIAAIPVQSMEIHLVKGHMPGYFWIFPLVDGLANVGFGALSEDISRRRINLRKSLDKIIQSAPGLRQRFLHAEKIGPTLGYGLPLGSRRLPISGERYVLCGDAASLIDPATGEGIGNAMWSGSQAAEFIHQAFQQGDVSAASLKAYDEAVYAKLGKDLRRKYRLQRLVGDREWLVNIAVKTAANSRFLQRAIRDLF